LQPGEFRVYLNRNFKSVPSLPPVVDEITSFKFVVYPNPADRNGFKVKVENPEAGRVSIQMYNAIGQRVAILHQGVLSKGTHILEFERNKIKTMAGIYFIKVVSPALTRTVHILIP
jgi:hypothetical protein